MATSLNRFLRDCVAAVAQRPVRGVAFVLGNEGGDMDSVVGSIFLALHLATSAGGYTAGSPSPVVPLLNFSIDDLPLRGDVAKLLRRLGIEDRLLCYVGSPSGASPAAAATRIDLGAAANDIDTETTALLLFDHNALCERQAHLAPLVAGCVDHHVDEKKYLDKPRAVGAPFAMRRIEPVGSASSLVAELFRDSGTCDVVLPELLFAPICLDTYNFDPLFERVTPIDVGAASFLLPLIRAASPEFDQSALYEGLKADKFSVSHLTAPQALRRDFKLFCLPAQSGGTVTIGISSVLELAGDFVARLGAEQLLADALHYAAANRLDVLMVMFAAADGDAPLVRQLLVLVPSLARVSVQATMRDMAAHSAVEAAALAPLSDGPDGALTELQRCAAEHDATALLYMQGNATLSRKTLTPLLAQYVASVQL